MARTTDRPTYQETTTIEVERAGVRIRIEGIPARTNPVGGEVMIPGPLSVEISDALERIIAGIERHRAAEEVEVTTS
jgi:hypothetical protein